MEIIIALKRVSFMRFEWHACPNVRTHTFSTISRAYVGHVDNDTAISAIR